jgi:hypothetical protein
MTRSQLLRSTTAAMATSALLISGCGETGHATTSAAAAGNRTSTAQVSVNAYINSVTALERPIQAAASTFFHAPNVQAARVRAARTLRHAYTTAVNRLSAITPPTVALAAHKRLISTWSTAAASLTRVLDRRPFSYPRAYAIGAAQERPTASAYDDILTLP